MAVGEYDKIRKLRGKHAVGAAELGLECRRRLSALPGGKSVIEAGSKVSILTGGGDKPYALGLAFALMSEGISFDFIGSDSVNDAALRENPNVRFLNLRGEQSTNVSRARKITRVLRYYARLIRYAVMAEPLIFHVLWNNKIEFFDRTILMLYYRMLGKRLVLTAHNVNTRKRDASDSLVNRLSLRVQYQLSDHIFVHTERMKRELLDDFDVAPNKVSVIPFGINNTIPVSDLSSADAKRRLGICDGEKTLLFFGNIAPYKGLEYLVAAFSEVLARDRRYRLVIAGRPKLSTDYWKQIQQDIIRRGVSDRVTERIEYVPDEETELYFKAADVLVLPYSHIFQSGVMFLGYSLGLPVIAADVGSLREEIIEGKTGYVFKSKDSGDLARVIERYFGSELFRKLESRRVEIRRYANDQYSWDKVIAITIEVYRNLSYVFADGSCYAARGAGIGCEEGYTPK